jgi:hypothetical protein
MEDQTTLGCLKKLIQKTENLGRVIEDQQIIIDQLESQIRELDSTFENRNIEACKVIPLKCG